MSLNFSDVPPGVDINDSHQATLYAAYSSTFGLAVISVVLRYLCRLRNSGPGLGWDDWLVLMGLTMATGQFIAMIFWVKGGVGLHIYVTGYEGFSHFLSTLFGIEILYTLSIMFTKFSILAFYWRIFGRDNIRIPLYILGPIITGWSVGVILTTIFQCSPIRGFWDKTIESTCGVDTDRFFIGNAIPNILTDWALLALPIPFLWRLQRSTSQKIALVGVFALGGFVCIISIIRLAIMLNAYKVPSIDLTWVFIGPSTWTAVEVNIGIVSACLPSLRPVLNFVIRPLRPNRSSSRKYHNGGGSGRRNVTKAHEGHPDYSASAWSRQRRSMFIRNADTLISAGGSTFNDTRAGSVDLPEVSSTGGSGSGSGKLHSISVETTVAVTAESASSPSLDKELLHSPHGISPV